MFYQGESFLNFPLERLSQGQVRAKKIITMQTYCCRWVYTKLLFLPRNFCEEFFWAIAGEGKGYPNTEQNVSAWAKALSEPTQEHKRRVWESLGEHRSVYQESVWKKDSSV